MADTFIIENLKPTKKNKNIFIKYFLGPMLLSLKILNIQKMRTDLLNIFQDQCKFFKFFSCNLFLDEIKAIWFTTNVANYLQNRIGWCHG